MEDNNTIFIGIAGGSSSGKTTVVNKIKKALKSGKISMLDLDSYYKPFDNIDQSKEIKINYDHPDSIDTDLLVKHLNLLKNNHSIEKPIYDFTTSSRTNKTTTILPTKIVIVEGILIFAIAKIRELFDMKIFIDTPNDIRFIRRLKRDIAERGRTIESVEKQYFETVRPMHLQFIEPSKQYADIIIPRGGNNKIAINMVTTKIKNLINEK